MIRNFCISFSRSMIRHPLYAAINLVGLGCGIAVLIALSLFVRFETGFEEWIGPREQIYEVQTRWLFPGSAARPSFATMGGLLDDLRANNPSLIGTRVWDQEVNVHVRSQTTREQAELVDADFFTVFDVDVIAGDKVTALSSPDNLVITEKMAQKYFRDEPALGKTLRLTDRDGTRDYQIAGILKTPPRNTKMRFDILRLLTPRRMALEGRVWQNYGSTQLETYLRFDHPEDARTLNAGFDDVIDRYAGRSFPHRVPHSQIHLRAVPLTAVHLSDNRQRTAVTVLGLVGLLAFAAAAINYVNLATARAGLRAREVAVRRVLGARTSSLRLQFLSEACLTVLLAIVIGFSLCEMTLPLINSYGGLDLALDYRRDGSILVTLAAAVLLTGLLAGLYPAFVLSSFRPALVLASSRTPTGGRLGIRVRAGLVVIQFTVVIAFFVMISGFFSQMIHIASADLGFQHQGLILTTATRDAAITGTQQESVWDAFKGLPGVVSVAASDAAPGDDENNNAENDVVVEGRAGPALRFSWTVTGPAFFETYGARLLAGRPLDAGHGGDLRSSGRDWDGSDAARGKPLRNVIVNRTAADRIGGRDPADSLGRILKLGVGQTLSVVGVVDDLRFHSLKDAVPPMIYFFDTHPPIAPVTAVRFSGVSEPVMRARLAEAWRHVAPDIPFTAVSADDNLDRYYVLDRNRSNLFTAGTVVAALIGCIGLYGMAAFNTAMRSREIGLRKVLGASRRAVVRLLVVQFLRPVLLAVLLAWPISFWALRHWLAQFNDRISLGAWHFLAPTAVALVLAAATVAGSAFAGAGAEPGKSLRHD